MAGGSSNDVGVADLAGRDVHGADGTLVGRVRDVYLRDRTSELTAITVTRGRMTTASVLVPVSAIASADEDPVVLRIDARTARDGDGPPETGHATDRQLRDAANALGIDEAPAG